MAKKSMKQLEADFARLAKEMAENKAQQKELRKAQEAKLEKRLGKICVSAFGIDALLSKSDEELNTFCENFKADLAEYKEHDDEAQDDDADESSEEELDDETEDVESDFSETDDDLDSASKKSTHTSYNPAFYG